MLLLLLFSKPNACYYTQQVRTKPVESTSRLHKGYYILLLFFRVPVLCTVCYCALLCVTVCYCLLMFVNVCVLLCGSVLLVLLCVTVCNCALN